MERNQLTGLFLLSAMLMVYLLFFAPNPEELPQPQATDAPKIERKTPEGLRQEARNEQQARLQLPDSALSVRYGAFAAAMRGENEALTLENNDVRLRVSTQGGIVSHVLLKNFVTDTKQPLILLDEASSYLREEIEVNGEVLDLNTLYYTPSQENNRLVLTALDANGEALVRKTYTLQDTGFVVGYQLDLLGKATQLGASEIWLSWKNFLKKVERDLGQSRMRSTVNVYTTTGELDYPSETSNSLEEMTFAEPVRWFAMKQKFFNTALITDAAFENVRVSTEANEADTSTVKIMQANVHVPLQTGSTQNANLRFYFGPNDYHLCKSVAPEFERNVYLGWSFFSAINLYLIMPLFEFLEGYISNYGIIILILVFIVKSILFPLTYRSYVSMAKMKVLKPEMDEIKARVGDDQMKMQQETMELYRQVGVSPLSGCIPVLAQMPIFLAMYNFFPNAIQLRQESFLWANDLSSYDSILDLPFTIPMYGAHVSLFTLLMAGSTIVYTYINNQMSSATLQGPMKSIGYITPVIFMVFLNTFSAGLTYYYFVSNLITIFQQILIRKFVDEDKIHNILMNNKKKNVNKKKSRFQQRLEDAMKQGQQGKDEKPKALPKAEPKDYKTEVEGSAKVLNNNGKAQIEVEIKNRSSENLHIEYTLAQQGTKSIFVLAGRSKKQRFTLKDMTDDDAAVDIVRAISK